MYINQGANTGCVIYRFAFANDILNQEHIDIINRAIEEENFLTRDLVLVSMGSAVALHR